MAAAPRYLYHVTYLYNLPAIQRHGLVPGAGQVFGGGYAGHSRGRLFLADRDGVDFWFGRYEELAEHHTDHPEEGWVPIVFEVDAKGLKLHEDEPGSRDSRAESYFTTEIVEPKRLKALWDGRAWVDPEDADADEMVARALDAAEVEEEDGEAIYWMDFDVFKPED